MVDDEVQDRLILLVPANVERMSKSCNEVWFTRDGGEYERHGRT